MVCAAGCRAFVACVARGFKPRIPEWAVIFDCFQAVVAAALTAKGENIVRLPKAQIMRRNTEILGNHRLGFRFPARDESAKFSPPGAASPVAHFELYECCWPRHEADRWAILPWRGLRCPLPTVLP